MAAIIQPYKENSEDQNPQKRAPRSRRRPIDYPTGDGKPMAEDSLHRDLMSYAIPALQLYFATRADVYVSGNDFVYYEEGNVKARVSPDTYVVIGVQKKYRPSYKIWAENGITPTVVFEFTSKKTRKEDLTIKQPLYEQVLRVTEYFRFDPTGDYLRPRLQGQHLSNGRYLDMPLGNERIYSEQLGLDLVIQGETLRFYDPVRGEWLPTYQEAETARQTEARRADAAEEELVRLRAEIEALRRNP